MFIKQISTESSRTFELPGQQGRSRYVKITTGAVAELLEDENPREEYKKLSEFVRSSIRTEVQQLRDANKNKTSEVGNDKGGVRRTLLG